MFFMSYYSCGFNKGEPNRIFKQSAKFLTTIHNHHDYPKKGLSKCILIKVLLKIYKSEQAFAHFKQQIDGGGPWRWRRHPRRCRRLTSPRSWRSLWTSPTAAVPWPGARGECTPAAWSHNSGPPGGSHTCVTSQQSSTYKQIHTHKHACTCTRRHTHRDTNKHVHKQTCVFSTFKHKHSHK